MPRLRSCAGTSHAMKRGAARIAGVLTIVNDLRADEIGLEAMRPALMLADWCVNEALPAFSEPPALMPDPRMDCGGLGSSPPRAARERGAGVMSYHRCCLSDDRRTASRHEFFGLNT